MGSYHNRSKKGKTLSTQHRENRENDQQIPCQGKYREFVILGKTQGTWFAQLCKFPDNKGKRYFDICHENFQIILRLDKSAKSVLCM